MLLKVKKMVDTNKLFHYEIQEPNDYSWMIWESDFERLQREHRADLLFQRFREMNIVPGKSYEKSKHDGCYLPQEKQAYQKREIGYDWHWDRPHLMVMGKAYSVMTLQEEFRPSKEETPGQAIL